MKTHQTIVKVRYAETDQMEVLYLSRRDEVCIKFS